MGCEILKVNENGNGCPEGYCNGTEILCVSIPCPVTIVLLGLRLQLEVPCIRLTSGQNLTSDQINRLLGVITGLLGNIGTVLGQ